jgi:Ni/Fe-hydrogenase subunit HybB-like protein
VRRSGNLGFALAVIALFGVAAVGAFAYLLQLRQGDVVTGMRTVGAGGAVWGLYVVMDGFFLGSGIALMSTACIARFSRDRGMEAAARIAMPSAITCFLGAGLCVLADQGRPLAALVSLSYYARPQSPMFVTFTSVGAICLLGSLVHCVLARRPDLAEYAKRPSMWRGLQRLLAAGYAGTPGQRYRRKKASFWMSLFMLVALLPPATALAILFVVRPGRTLDVVLLEVTAFMLLSLAGGVGLLIVASALVGRLVGREAGVPARGMARLGRWLLAAVSLSLLAVIAAEEASLGSGEMATAAFGRALLGSYGGLFWGAVVGLFLAAGLLLTAMRRRRGRTATLVVAGLAVEVALFLHHYYLLVAWQTHALALPYSAGHYLPTWVELAVVFGVVAISVLLLLLAVRLIPFAPIVAGSQPVPRKMRDGRRVALTWAWFVAGLAVATAGLLGAARVGIDPAMDPILTGSPIIFMIGLTMLATAGAVYELLPERNVGPAQGGGETSGSS